MRGSMVSIVLDATDPNAIQFLEFNRDLDTQEGNKMLGGGIRTCSLADFADKEVYAMRSSQEPLGESVDLADLIGRIDEAYHAGGYADSPFDIQGDCGVFLAGASAGDVAEGLAAEDLGVE